MAQPDKAAAEEAAKADKVKAAKDKAKMAHWQKHADHCNEMIAKMQEVLADGESTPEEVAEANETIANMQANLQRLKNRLAVEPTPVNQDSTPV